jgi:hypothetical protein
MLFYHVDDVLRATVCCVTADFQQFSFGHNDVIHHCGNFGLSVLTNQTIFQEYCFLVDFVTIVASVMQSPESLQEQLSALQSERRHLTEQLTLLRQTQRRRDLRAVYAGCPPHAQDMAVAVYILEGFDPAQAVTFLKVNNIVPADEDDRRLIELLESWVLSWPEDAVTSVAFPITDAQLRMHNDAQRFLAEAATVSWIRQQNAEHGRAPASVDVWNEFQRLLVQRVGGVAPLLAKRAARKFAHRLRRRWRINHRMLRCRDYEVDFPADLKRVRPSASYCVTAVSIVRDVRTVREARSTNV